MLFEKYSKYLKYVNGIPTDPPEYKQGERIGIEDFDSLWDCEKAALYKWVDTGETVCSKYNLYNKLEKYRSYDKGVTWTPLGEYKAGTTLIEEHSKQCGWELKVRWTPTGRQVCDGATLQEELVKEESYDGGETWIPTEEYIYINLNITSESCTLLAEPLTFQIHLETDESEVLNMGGRFKMIEDMFSYVDWGDTEHGYKEKIKGLLPNHTYRLAGDYQIRIWGVPHTIGSFNTAKGDMYYDLINWGTAYLWYAELPLNGEYVQGFKRAPRIVDMTDAPIRSMSEPTEMLKSISTFIMDNCTLITEFPSNLFLYSSLLTKSSFKNTKITKIPPKMFYYTRQTNFEHSFENCVNLTEIGDDAFNKEKSFSDVYYSDPEMPATKCKNCIESGVLDPSQCKNVNIAIWTPIPKPPFMGPRYSIKNITNPTLEDLHMIKAKYKLEDTYIRYEDLYILGLSANMSLGYMNYKDWGHAGLINAYKSIECKDTYPTKGMCISKEAYSPKWSYYTDRGSAYKYNYVDEDIYYDPIPDVEGYYPTKDTYVFSYTFKGCSNLKKVGMIFGQDPINLAHTREMFAYCTNLSLVANFLQYATIGGGFIYVYQSQWLPVPDFGKNYLYQFDYDYMFLSCESLKKTLAVSNNYYTGDGDSWKNWRVTAHSSYGMYVNSGIEEANLSHIPCYDYGLNIGFHLSHVFFGPNLKTVVGGNRRVSYEADELFRGIDSLVSVTNCEFNSAVSIFEDCTALTTLTGTKIHKNATTAFKGCTNLVDIPKDLFPDNRNINATKCFMNCTKLTSIPNELILDIAPLDADTINVTNMFYGCLSLSSYPMSGDKPIWEWERFYDPTNSTTYKETLAFYKCPLITSQVPYPWGGTLLIDGYDFSYTILVKDPNTTIDFYVDYKNVFLNTYKYKTSIDDDSLQNSLIIIEEPGEYKVYIKYSENSYTFPEQTVSIDDCGILYDINIGRAKSNIKYIRGGKNLFKTRTNLDDIFRYCTALKDVDDNIFLNCLNVYRMSHPFNNCALPESKILTLLNTITSLTDASWILEDTNYTTTFGILKNNPGIINIDHAFANMPFLKSFPTYFAKGITDFTEAFANCNIQGESPTNQEGYKLWHLRFVSGYPKSVIPGRCFIGCTQLTDYKQIPKEWK